MKIKDDREYSVEEIDYGDVVEDENGDLWMKSSIYSPGDAAMAEGGTLSRNLTKDAWVNVRDGSGFLGKMCNRHRKVKAKLTIKGVIN